MQKKARVVKSIKAYAKQMEDWVRPIKKIKRFRPAGANAFLLGVMFDRNIEASLSWSAAEWVNDSLGDSDDVSTLWRNLIKIDRERLKYFLQYGNGGHSFHRFYNSYVKYLPETAEIILKKYDGDPRKIWNNIRDVELVMERLEELPGIGMALSRMAVLNLVRNFGLLGGIKSLSQLDIKPDIHVMRVFKRVGLIGADGTRVDAIDAARKFNPRFPAELDAPSWEIGANFCRPNNALCSDCPITDVCPKLF